MDCISENRVEKQVKNYKIIKTLKQSQTSVEIDTEVLASSYVLGMCGSSSYV